MVSESKKVMELKKKKKLLKEQFELKKEIASLESALVEENGNTDN